MKNANVVCVVGVLLMATMASAATVWNPAANGIFPPATGNWNDAANWTNDVPGVADGKAVFNVDGAAECVVTDAQTFTQLVLGDNGPGGVLRVMDGGRLTTGAVWSAVGYNNDANMIVETGGSVTFGEHLWVGFRDGSVGTLDLLGGHVRVSEMFGLGWDATAGTGLVNVIAGHLDLHNIHATNSIQDDSVLDVHNGIVTVDGNHLGKVTDYIAASKIVGFGGEGTVNASYDADTDKTIFTAVHPLEPFPTEDIIVSPGEVELRWTLPDPCVPGQPVPVDVYITDDYYALKDFADPASIRVISHSNVTSVTMTAVGQTRYWWAVDAYVGSASDPVYSPIFSFWVGNQPPTVEISADPPAAWLAGGNDVNLDATITDDATETEQITKTWSVVSEPNEGTAIIANPAAEDTVVTFTETGVYTLRLTADDGEAEDNIGTAEITIEVFDNSCEAAKSLPGFVPIPGDFNADCREDFLDFALFAAGWLDCNALDCSE